MPVKVEDGVGVIAPHSYFCVAAVGQRIYSIAIHTGVIPYPLRNTDVADLRREHAVIGGREKTIDGCALMIVRADIDILALKGNAKWAVGMRFDGFDPFFHLVTPYFTNITSAFFR